MTASANRIRVDPRLVDEAARVLGARSRTEAIQMALYKIVERRQFSRLMRGASRKSSIAENGE
jgi:Arc/MetJ family transcription regulator